MPDIHGTRAKNLNVNKMLIEPVTDDQVRRARLRCAEAAESPEDLSLILAMLGLGSSLAVRVEDRREGAA